MRGGLIVMGGGRMGAALVGGLLAAGWEPETVTVVEADASRRAELERTLSGVTVVAEPPPTVRDESTTTTAPGGPIGAVVAVKPADAETAVRGLAASGPGRVLSIMAGVRLARLEGWVGPEVAVLRAMPNTPALIGAGMSGLAGGSAAGAADVAWAGQILGAVGQVVTVAEAALDAVTGLSGSGPAYIFLVAEALIAAGVERGLDPAVSRQLAVETIAGAGRLLKETGEDPEKLRAQVTSPGGTTQAGLEVLESRGLREAFGAAVRAATERSEAMSGS
jgi:pyrroline-5-carboxylate reductase